MIRTVLTALRGARNRRSGGAVRGAASTDRGLARAATPAPGFEPPYGVLPWFNPLTIAVAPELGARPTLNLLVPRIAMVSMSGGPATAINLGCRLAERGVAVRLVSADLPIDSDPAPFWGYARALAQASGPLPHANLELVDAADRAKPLVIGANDVFMATAWWTAQMAKYAIRYTRHECFVYLIQDYEPLLHPASTQQALAEETYRLMHLPIVNTRLLHDFLVERQIGRYSDPRFAEGALVFEPAVDRTHFYCRQPGVLERLSKRKRLLFYARPSTGARNLFELGVSALQKLVADRNIDPEQWQFVGMGDAFEPVALGRGAVLNPVPWLDFAGYARQMRESDVLLSLMLSPHPSYPPLEMAACGRPVVTTCFATKTAARLAELSPNIIGVEPTIEAISDGLVTALARQETIDSDTRLPNTWSESFAEVVPRLHEALMRFQASKNLSR
jgi:hypothetical protein